MCQASQESGGEDVTQVTTVRKAIQERVCGGQAGRYRASVSDGANESEVLLPLTLPV